MMSYDEYVKELSGSATTERFPLNQFGNAKAGRGTCQRYPKIRIARLVEIAAHHTDNLVALVVEFNSSPEDAGVPAEHSQPRIMG
jgi:hypothetical protein